MDARRRKGDFLLTHTDFFIFKVGGLPAAPAAELAVLPVPRKAELDMRSMTIMTIVSLQVQRFAQFLNLAILWGVQTPALRSTTQCPFLAVALAILLWLDLPMNTILLALCSALK
jgi:hypothetical protein